MTFWLAVVFFLSGAAALIYQIVWQRALFVIYGLDAISVTMVVTAFMLGLGIGSLAGGALSRAYPKREIALFAASELAIAIFGFYSLDLFRAIAGLTSGIGAVATGLMAFLLVVIPTVLMGMTLPLLVSYNTARSGSVGHSVSTLYFVNTLGAAAGAFFTAGLLLPGLELGLMDTVHATALLNACLGAVVFGLAALERKPA